jgi:hypothetical protein
MLYWKIGTVQIKILRLHVPSLAGEMERHSPARLRDLVARFRPNFAWWIELNISRQPELCPGHRANWK